MMLTKFWVAQLHGRSRFRGSDVAKGLRGGSHFSYSYATVEGTVDFRMVVQICNGKWRELVM